MYTNIYSWHICNGQETGNSKHSSSGESINYRKHVLIIGYYSVIRKTDTYRNINEFQMYYAEWKKTLLRHDIWFHSHDVLERWSSWDKKIAQWLPRAEVRQGTDLIIVMYMFIKMIELYTIMGVTDTLVLKNKIKNIYFLW